MISVSLMYWTMSIWCLNKQIQRRKCTQQLIGWVKKWLVLEYRIQIISTDLISIFHHLEYLKPCHSPLPAFTSPPQKLWIRFSDELGFLWRYHVNKMRAFQIPHQKYWHYLNSAHKVNWEQGTFKFGWIHLNFFLWVIKLTLKWTVALFALPSAQSAKSTKFY